MCIRDSSPGAPLRARFRRVIATSKATLCPTITHPSQNRRKSPSALDVYKRQGLHREALIATGVVLFVFILLINLCFSLLKRRMD